MKKEKHCEQVILFTMGINLQTFSWRLNGFMDFTSKTASLSSNGRYYPFFVVVVVLKPLLLLVYQGFLYYLFIFLMLNLFLFIWFIQDTFCPSGGISLTASIGHFIDIWWPHTHIYTSLSYSSDLMTICLSKVGNLLLTLRFFFSSSKSSKGMSISFP